MCLIIRKPPGRRVPDEFLANAWARNGDGWGLFFALDAQLYSSRGLSYAELVATNATLPVQAEVYLHLRKATSGDVTEEMTHPFVVRRGLLLMHNGAICRLVPAGANKGKSDTWELARLLRDLTKGFSDAQVRRLIRSEGFNRLSSALVLKNVMVLQDTQGTVRLGRAWHCVTPNEWDETMVGIEVSNRHAWTPKAVDSIGI